MLEFDAEAARQIEAVYLTADIVEQRRQVLRLLGLTAGEAGWTASEVSGWTADLRELGADYFFSLNRYVFCATR